MIASIEVLAFESSIVVPFAISRESKETARIVIVRLIDQNGTVGLGEASPFVSLTGDTAEMAFAEAQRLKHELCGKTCADFLSHMELIYGESRRRSATGIIAFEMAYYDLMARRHGQPLWQRFGNGPKRPFVTDITLPILSASGIERFWNHFRGYGFPIIKVKVSGNVTADIDMIETFFAVVDRDKPSETPLAFSLDGNQGFDTERSLTLLAKLAAAGRHPLFFEQPLPDDDWEGSATLTGRSTVPICLDESIKSCRDLQRAKEIGAGHMVNLKIMKAGLAETERIAHQAKQHGYKLMIGGMLESEIAMSVSLHLAIGSGLVDYFDLDTPFFLERHPTKDSPWHAKRAFLGVSEQPGTGLELTA